MSTRRHLSSVLDAAERSGKLDLRIEDIAAALPGHSPAALRQALQRQQVRGRIVRVSRGSGHWLLVPLQYASFGAPPLEAWLHHYLTGSLHIPYYVALLSAAESYGASPQAVMVVEVMVTKPRRRIMVGLIRIFFSTRARLEEMPTRWYETQDGRVKVSTPELTALELVQRSSQHGGIASVRAVLDRLSDACTEAGMSEALDAAKDVPAAQRLGVLLTMDNRTALAQCVLRWLSGKHLRMVWMEAPTTPEERFYTDPDFKVRAPNYIGSSNA